jgi:integrase
MKVRKFKMTSGELYSIFLQNDGLPSTYPNLFVTIHHRNAGDSANTSHAVFERLSFFYEICEFLNIDIVQRCHEGDFLKQHEIETIAKWACRSVKSFREHVQKQRSSNVVSISPSRKKIETARASFVVDAKGDIAKSTAYNRVTTFSQYIGWLEDELFPSKASNNTDLMKRFRPRRFNILGDINHIMGSYKSLTVEQMGQVLNVVQPNAPENPWKNESIRYRNELIINLYEALGCRRSELMKVRIDDMKTNPSNGQRYVQLRSKSDLNDNRLNRPEAKTRGRMVPLDKRLCEMYDNYVIHYRSQARGAEFIQYLFITHNESANQNRALSNESINKICRQIASLVGFRVHPHAFRHSWNDRYSELADQRIKDGKVTADKSESDRQKLMGWAEGSPMAMHYSSRHENKRAFDVGLKLQKDRSSSKGKGKDKEQS